MENKVVKCINDKCALYFMRAEKNIKFCPFCKTEYVEIQEKTVEEKPKEKKLVVKTQKESFKVWKK